MPLPLRHTRTRPDFSWAKFPKVQRIRKAKSRRATTPEQVLQDYAEGLLDAYAMPYLRLSGTLMRAIFANPAIPIHVKKIVSDELAGWPDLLVIRKGDNGENRLFACELKTDIGKLRASQKRRARDISFVVLRTEAEIKTFIERARA